MCVYVCLCDCPWVCMCVCELHVYGRLLVSVKQQQQQQQSRMKKNHIQNMWQGIMAHVQQQRQQQQQQQPHPPHLWANDIINMKTPLIFFADYDVTVCCSCCYFLCCSAAAAASPFLLFSLATKIVLFFIATHVNRPAVRTERRMTFLSLYLTFYVFIIYFIYLHAQHANADNDLAVFDYDFNSLDALRACPGRLPAKL